MDTAELKHAAELAAESFKLMEKGELSNEAFEFRWDSFRQSTRPATVLELIDTIERLQRTASALSLEIVELRESVPAAVAAMSDDQRLELFGNYCRSCGCADPRCQCWNDE